MSFIQISMQLISFVYKSIAFIFIFYPNKKKIQLQICVENFCTFLSPQLNVRTNLVSLCTTICHFYNNNTRNRTTNFSLAVFCLFLFLPIDQNKWVIYFYFSCNAGNMIIFKWNKSLFLYLKLSHYFLTICAHTIHPFSHFTCHFINISFSIIHFKCLISLRLCSIVRKVAISTNQKTNHQKKNVKYDKTVVWVISLDRFPHAWNMRSNEVYFMKIIFNCMLI